VHAFAKLKALLQKAAARSREALWAAIGRQLDTFTPDESRNYLANSGYASERTGKTLDTLQYTNGLPATDRLRQSAS
jgi:hypothetical protein